MTWQRQRRTNRLKYAKKGNVNKNRVELIRTVQTITDRSCETGHTRTETLK